MTLDEVKERLRGLEIQFREEETALDKERRSAAVVVAGWHADMLRKLIEELESDDDE